MKIKKEATRRKVNYKLAAVFVFFALLTLQIIYTIQISSFGGKLAKLEEDYEIVALENVRLTREIVSSSSLTSLTEVANTEGYVKPTSIVYIKDVEFVASAN